MSKKYKVSFVLGWAFLLMSLTTYSQNQRIDSLKRIVETEAKDTAMVVTLNNLGLELLNQGDIDESLNYSEKARDLATELGYIKGKALSLKQIGNANYYKGNFLEVFDFGVLSGDERALFDERNVLISQEFSGICFGIVQVYRY